MRVFSAAAATALRAPFGHFSCPRRNLAKSALVALTPSGRSLSLFKRSIDEIRERRLHVRAVFLGEELRTSAELSRACTPDQQPAEMTEATRNAHAAPQISGTCRQPFMSTLRPAQCPRSTAAEPRSHCSVSCSYLVFFDLNSTDWTPAGTQLGFPSTLCCTALHLLKPRARTGQDDVCCRRC